MARNARRSGYRSRIVLSHQGRVLETFNNTTLMTSPRDALMSGLRSLARCMRRTPADGVAVYVEWQQPINGDCSHDHPTYQVAFAMPAVREHELTESA